MRYLAVLRLAFVGRLGLSGLLSSVCIMSACMTEKTEPLQELAMSSWRYEGGVIRFEQNRYRIDFACNVIMGEFEQDGAQLRFGPAVSTRMYCGQDIHDKEYKTSTLLEKMQKLHVDADGRVVLEGDGAQMLMERIAP